MPFKAARHNALPLALQFEEFCFMDGELAAQFETSALFLCNEMEQIRVSEKALGKHG